MHRRIITHVASRTICIALNRYAVGSWPADRKLRGRARKDPLVEYSFPDGLFGLYSDHGADMRSMLKCAKTGSPVGDPQVTNRAVDGMHQVTMRTKNPAEAGF